MPIRTAAAAIAASVALLACATAGPAANSITPANVRACAVTRAAGASDVDHAIACAEEFVARNGYTAAPADTTRLAGESIEWGPSWADVLARRRNQLQPRAVGVCGATTVVFAFVGENSDHARAVTMTENFDEMRVQHRNFILATIRERRLGCQPIPQTRQP